MYVRTYVCMYVRLYVCMYVCTHVYVYVCMCVCMYVYMCVCICVCMYVCKCVCMYVCMCVCMYVSVYVYMCVCMYVCHTKKPQYHTTGSIRMQLFGSSKLLNKQQNTLHTFHTIMLHAAKWFRESLLQRTTYFPNEGIPDELHECV